MKHLWDFHGIPVLGQTNAQTVATRWQPSFASRPQLKNGDPEIAITLTLVDAVPPAPQRAPDFTQTDLLAYYVSGSSVIAHFPRYGQLTLDLSNGTTQGVLIPAAVETYGVLEDLLAIGLSPHLRRKGYFLIHAFAAAYHNKAALIVGGIGAGKTTTGMSLLNAGWQLLSNDSPIIAANAQCLSYPGVLAGYPETFARFETCSHLVNNANVPKQGRKKLSIPAEAIWSNVWQQAAPVKVIIFPKVANSETHQLTPLSTIETLKLLLPHAVEQWDRTVIPQHLGILRTLAESAQAFQLDLSPDVLAIPGTLQPLLNF